MSITSEADWKGLREVGRIVRLTLDAMEARVAPGITTAQLDRVAAAIFAREGARSAPALVYGFPAAVLISVNDEVVHGVPGPRQLCDGDIVKLDVTAEKNGYMADAARTIVLSDAGADGDAPRRKPTVAERLRACAEAAFTNALAVARAGNLVSDIGRAVDSEVRRFGFRVIPGLGGHGIGRTIHEPPSVPNQFDPRQHDRLTDGLVVTIEPIISAGSPEAFEARDGWTIKTKDGSLSAHHEHTIVITDADPVLLTAA
jgi:methionyl aminopeptidase